jgi:hypothetical protein
LSLMQLKRWKLSDPQVLRIFEISKEVVKRTRLMLQSEDLVRVGAGVYAWGEIVGHHAARDVVYLKTHPEFLGLENKVRDLAAKHPSLKKLSDGAIMKSNGTREANNLAPEFLAS